MKPPFVLVCALALLSRTHASPADLDPGFKMARLHNGLNSVDVDADGRKDSVVVARRENYNAHGFEATTIYVWAKTVREDETRLHIVPLQLETKDGKATGLELLELRAGGGADGLLEDFRLFVDAAHHRAVVIRAEREFGDSFADTQPVTFEYFELTRNTEAVPGSPTLQFKPYKKQTSKKGYQDVNEAFKAELNVGPDGRQGS